MNKLILFAAGFFFTGCAVCNQCHITSSRSLDPGKQLKVLVLPVTTNGNPTVATLPNYSDDISTALIESGFHVIDRIAAEEEAANLGLDLRAGIADKDVKALAAALNVDAVMLASIAYAFQPAESGTTPYVMNTVTDSTGKIRNVSVKGAGEYQRSERYVMTSMSARMIDARTMQTLMSAYAVPAYGKGVNTWMVEMLREKLAYED